MKYLGHFNDCQLQMRDDKYYMIYTDHSNSVEIKYFAIAHIISARDARYEECVGFSLRKKTDLDMYINSTPTRIDEVLHLNLCRWDEVWELTDVEVSVALMHLI